MLDATLLFERNRTHPGAFAPPLLLEGIFKTRLAVLNPL